MCGYLYTAARYPPNRFHFGDMSMRGALALLLVLCSAGPAAALIAGTQCRAVPSLAARPSARCCAAEQAVVEEAPEPCDFPGCDGRGRALGGLAAIPLFSWWPIKVHRHVLAAHQRHR